MKVTAPRALIAAFALLLATLPGAVAHDGHTVPCLVPVEALCPDLIVDEDRMDPRTENREFSESSCAVQNGLVEPGNRTLLQFDTWTANVGKGDLTVGRPQDHPDAFERSECHGHQHLKGFAAYRLWNVTAYDTWDQLRKDNPDKTADTLLAENPDLADEMVEGRKQSFCLMDLWIYTAGVPKYTCFYQGISPGWVDIYSSGLPGQWIDITDVPNGTYVLEQETNVERILSESDHTNNRAAMTVEIPIPPEEPGCHAEDTQVHVPSVGPAPGVTICVPAEWVP